MNWIVVALGLLLMTWSAAVLWCSWASARWPVAEGEVEWSMITERRGRSGQTFYVPRIRYRYAVGPAQYVSHRRRFRPYPESYTTTAAAYGAVAGLAAGARVPVFYHPRLPRLAVLRPGYLLEEVAPLVLGAVLAVVGLVG